MAEERFYRISLSSGEALATLATLQAFHALLRELSARDLSADVTLDPAIIQSAAERIAEELPEFMVPQAGRLAQSLAASLRETMAMAGDTLFDDASTATEPPFPIARNRRLLQDAFEQGKNVEIEYYVASRREWTTRDVAISDVYKKNDEWYLSGQCGLRSEYRHFKLDHIRSVRTVNEEEDVPDPFGE